MKKILTLALLTSFATAGLFSTVSGLGMKEKKTDKEYTLDTAGMNPRVYEFTPVTAPHMQCILIVLNAVEPSSTLQCFSKKAL
jgi:hypothetical protein